MSLYAPTAVNLVAAQEQAIRTAICHKLGIFPWHLDCDIKFNKADGILGRGEMRVRPTGEQEFFFDGELLLVFHPPEIQMVSDHIGFTGIVAQQKIEQHYKA